MEGEPKQELLTIEQQAQLAEEMLEASNDRNLFTDSFGGTDTFLDAAYHVDMHRQEYDRLVNAFEEKRKKFLEEARDKKSVVEYLKQQGETDKAERIEKMFGLK